MGQNSVAISAGRIWQKKKHTNCENRLVLKEREINERKIILFYMNAI